MSQVTRIAAVALVSALAGGISNAQLLTHKDLSLAMAVTMATTAIDTCKSQGYAVSVNVLGRNGEVILAVRGDAANPTTLENSMKKAYTARTFRRPSGEFAKGVKDNPTAGALFLTLIGSAPCAGVTLVRKSAPAVTRTKPAPRPASTRFRLS